MTKKKGRYVKHVEEVDEWKTNLMSLAILFHFLCAQHISDINISIIMRSNTQRTENKTTDVVIHQHCRKLLMMDILMSEACWAHKKWNKIASDIKLVFHSSTITMMHVPINIRFTWKNFECAWTSKLTWVLWGLEMTNLRELYKS